uniref:Uncharacterized protein n=1 Tax=Mesocestoides corti TaxID=53468 RepID=A0A5K3EI28_MESCO
MRRVRGRRLGLSPKHRQASLTPRLPPSHAHLESVVLPEGRSLKVSLMSHCEAHTRTPIGRSYSTDDINVSKQFLDKMWPFSVVCACVCVRVGGWGGSKGDVHRVITTHHFELLAMTSVIVFSHSICHQCLFYTTSLDMAQPKRALMPSGRGECLITLHSHPTPPPLSPPPPIRHDEELKLKLHPASLPVTYSRTYTHTHTFAQTF